MEDSPFLSSPVLTRIKDPLLWATLSTGYRIEDLTEKRFDEALQFLKEYYMKEELLCKCSDLASDPVSVKNLAESCMAWMKDLASVVAIEEATGKLVGVQVNRVIEKLGRTRTFSRIKIRETLGEAFQKVTNLSWYMHRYCNFYELFKVDRFLRVFALSVHPAHRDKGVGMGLMKSTLKLAETMRLPAMMGIFTSARSQSLAGKLGMTMIMEIKYMDYKLERDQIFTEPGHGNYSAMVMGMLVGNVTPKPLSIYPPMESLVPGF